MVGMAAYAKRYPRELSGGQQQRVAIARALAIRPQVLLLDEPLSALDAQIRRSMLDELARLHRDLPSLTVLYVTHDQTEALTLADHIGIMRDGRLMAFGDRAVALSLSAEPLRGGVSRPRQPAAGDDAGSQRDGGIAQRALRRHRMLVARNHHGLAARQRLPAVRAPARHASATDRAARATGSRASVRQRPVARRRRIASRSKSQGTTLRLDLRAACSEPPRTGREARPSISQPGDATLVPGGSSRVADCRSRPLAARHGTQRLDGALDRSAAARARGAVLLSALR